VVGLLLVVGGLLLAGLARGGWLGSSTRESADSSLTLPNVAGLVGTPLLRASVGERIHGVTTVRVEVTAPRGAEEMVLSDDPSFGGAAWQPVAAQGEVRVVSVGYVEIFGRFRAKAAASFVPAVTGITIAGPAQFAAGASAGVTSLGAVRPNVLALTITTQRAQGSEKVVPLDPAQWDVAANFTLTSTDDPAYLNGRTATTATRTSRPIDMGPENSTPRFTVEHRLFVSFDTPLSEGKNYRLTPRAVAPVDVVFDSHSLLSPAVQVNQVGFMPRDPAKVAFLSASLAGQQPIDYADRTGFDVVDVTTGATKLSGAPVKRQAGNDGEYGKGDLTGAPVWELDFSTLQEPGRYRVCVSGVGCSVDFAVSENGTWLKAASTVARAAFNQRSGISIGAPYSSIERPRIEHPDDGRTVEASGLSLLANGQGSNDTFDELVKQASGPSLKGAWGGHMDAGDWDRRIQHLWYLRAGLDLVDLFPETFGQMNLDLPESANAIPDVVDEGLWSLDLYLRLQEKSGGVRGGIEADAAPPKGQTSWSTKQRLFAYAPDPWSSYLFAGAAAEASFALRTSDAKRSAIYLAAAQRAADWAAKQNVADPDGEIEGQRLVASAALYRATGDKKWHDEFLRNNPLVKGPVDQLQCPRHELCDAAWIYLRTADHPRNDSVVANAAESFRRTADSLLTAADTSLYRFSLDDPYVPLVWGLGPSTPKTTVLIRAYVLLGDQKYWAQAARAGGYSLGANPLNTSFVTGLGQNNPKHPLVVDQRDGGLPVWPGIPVYGTQKVTEGKDGEGWFPQYFLGPAGTKPRTNDTPLLWSWYDLPVFAAHNEYTLHQSHAAALFTFGSLAALAARKT
jgi:endoglucanase